MNFTQFSLCEAYEQRLVILTNTLFNDVESILVAPIQIQAERILIKGLQIPLIINDTNCYVDLLDIATISKKNIKPVACSDLSEYRTAIKAGLDLLIDGF
ncbi:CcdB family protein [Aliiglaciecola sp. 3_MG-2023]|uniref:CcdB family protein n=1 Tax=Aliiglaciecola sp. 3_MG-2023 TaxID=3062644 RepID=UPI0026E3A8C6|nr:CcdB family protein [Aliiglaciecola sp. 3_MG-2023]MDO6694775.1 CcdB family protein [Aliiglaciecola sp. 3_MG-2023]